MREFEALVTEAAQELHDRLMREPDISLWLYYVPSTETEWGRFVSVREVDEPPTGGMPVDPRRVPSNRDRVGLRAWLRSHAGSLPLLPTGRP
jgi:hypothetical protein